MIQKPGAAKKTTGISVLRGSGRNRTFIAVRFRKPAPDWEKNLEDNLVEEGFARAKARELVKLAAS